MSDLVYGFKKTVDGDVPTVEEHVRKALADEGFGVLTEIDVSATFATKLGEVFPAYRILGACNPHLAHQALQAEIDIGLLLPCNVVVYDVGGGRTAVSILDPEKQLSVSGRTDLEGFATEVRDRMERVLAAV